MPYRKKDIDKLERIQRRSTKIIPELRDLSFESRLLQCGLTTLKTRRLRGDQIEVFKIVNGYEDVDRNMFFKSTQTDSISLLSATLSEFQNCSQNCERNSQQYDINTHEDLQLTHYFITLYVISLQLITSMIRAAMLCRRTCERYWQDPNTEKRDRV